MLFGINHHLVNIMPQEIKRLKFMYFLQCIIVTNTFQVGDSFYIQRIGVPMGMCLSGTLANIYLATLEISIYNIPKLLLFKRYMDDILIISLFEGHEMDTFIADLQEKLHLRLTASHNTQNVNFLDLTITFSRGKKCFTIHPYSKNFLTYPLPTLMNKRKFMTDLNIITGQILRTWRFSSDDYYFSRCIFTFLYSLPCHPFYMKLKHGIYKFLQPIQVRQSSWTTTIQLCKECHDLSTSKNINIHKIMRVDKKCLAVRQPINCQTQIGLVLSRKENHEDTNLLHVFSIHQFLKQNKEEYVNILPLGKFNADRLRGFLQQNPNVIYIHRQRMLTNKSLYPCYVHAIVPNINKLYGMPLGAKSLPTLGRQFNTYKKAFI